VRSRTVPRNERERTVSAVVNEPSQPPSDSGLRASDADRERLVDELEQHAIAGRLTTDEFEERTGQAYEARTVGQLEALRHDLPPVPTGSQVVSRRQRRSDLTKRSLQETGGSAGLFVLCTVIWLASGASGQFWPVWVLLIVVLSLVRNGWALYGPGADLDAVEADLDARRDRRRQHAQHHGDHDTRRAERRNEHRRGR
jgi:hypothetical protein